MSVFTSLFLSFSSIPTLTPTGCAAFPNELAYQPKSLLQEKYHKLVRFTDMPRGGHFAAFEEPELLADDVWETIKIIRNNKNM
jgi:hypothetical protein